MIDPVKKQADKIRFDYLKKELTFEDYRKQREKEKTKLIIFAVVLCFFIYISFYFAVLYSLNSESNALWKKASIEMGKEICEEMNEEFVNLQISEYLDGTKRVTIHCSYKIKMFSLED